MKRGFLRTLRKESVVRWRMRQARSLPDALILGAQKCGTTTLQHYLTRQSGVIEPLRKEVHYFDLNNSRGEAWYRAHFGRAREPGLNLDSSPYYLFHPAVPGRVAALLPKAKFMVLLRDPVRRAHSGYWHQRHKGRETLSFEDAIAAEQGRIEKAHAQLADGSLELSYEHQHFSYLARGRYAEQLEQWFAVFPRARFHIVTLEELSKDPLRVLNGTLEFLGLPPAAAVDAKALNARRYPPMAESTAEKLREHFEPHDRRLERLLGRSVPW